MFLDEQTIRNTLFRANYRETNLTETALMLGQFPEQSEDIARVFKEVFQCCENSRRMYIIHLLNEVIQVSLDTTSNFLVSFGHIILDMATLIGKTDDEVLKSYTREMFSFWQTNSLFSRKIISELFAECNKKVEKIYPISIVIDETPNRKVQVKTILASPLAADLASLLVLSEEHNRFLLSKLAETELSLERKDNTDSVNAIKLCQLRNELEELKRAYSDFVSVSCWKIQEIVQNG